MAEVKNTIIELVSKLNSGEITESEYYKLWSEKHEENRRQEFNKLMMENGLSEEQANSIIPEVRKILEFWGEEMEELQRRVDDYANWIDNCPY
jgi:Asp-tRNA(Asn)/Glu-tRNA(Gln) amidotransferase B subunit